MVLTSDSENPERSEPLVGVRVIELCRLLPVSMATRRLVNLGADVVKVEPPEGDYVRTLGNEVYGGYGLHHWLLNRGKRSVCLDLLVESDLKRFGILLDRADVLIHNLRPGRLEEGSLAPLGNLVRETHRRRPSLTICSLSGFGETGPLSKLASHGFTIDSLSDAMVVSDEAEPRILTQAATAIALGASNAVIAILASLHGVKNGQAGRSIDTSCWDAGVDFGMNTLAPFLAGRTDGGKRDVNMGPLHRLYRCADGGIIFFAAIERKFWVNFCRAVSRPDLEQRWVTDRSVYFNEDGELQKELTALFLTRNRDEWAMFFIEHNTIGSPVLDMAGVVAHPHFAARQLVDDHSTDPVPELYDPIRWLDTGRRPGMGAGPVPGLGEHTEEVFSEWLTQQPANRTPSRDVSA